MKILVPGLLVFGIWCYASTYWYVCKIKYLCDEPVTASTLTSSNEPVTTSEDSVASNTPEEDEEIKIRESESGAIIHFGYNAVTPEQSDTLSAYLKNFTATHKDKSIQLIGHTDASGTEEYNYKLGLERAEAIKNMLVKNGWNPGSITTISKGETEPISEDSTSEGQYGNRRVEMIIE